MPSPAAPTRSRWPAATARRRSSRRSPRSSTFPTRASRRARETTSRSTSGSIATTSSVRSTHSWTAASAASTSATSTGACSSTTSRSASTPRRCSAPATGTRSSARCSTRCPTPSGRRGSGLDLRWTGPDGHEHHGGAVIMVSNNRYRLGRTVGSGTRPAIDDGLLGITVAGAPTGRGERGRSPQRPVREWTAPTFEVDADDPVPAGIDGEAAAPRATAALRASARGCCECASRLSIRAPRRRRSCPRAPSTALRTSRG